MRSVTVATAAMGTWFEVRLAGDDETALTATAEAAIEAIELCHTRLSRFEPSSLLAHLARVAPSAVELDRDTYQLFADAIEVWRDSDGRFDPTLMWDGNQVAAGGMERVELDPERRTIRMTGGAVPLDLGAIAKGHALDCAARIVRDSGVSSAFLHGGTSSGIAVGGGPDGLPWRISLGGGPESPVVSLFDRAFSVSSTLGRTFDLGGEIVGHLADPVAGVAVADSRTVAVLGPSARLADAWSTVVALTGQRPSVLGPEWEVWSDLPTAVSHA